MLLDFTSLTSISQLWIMSLNTISKIDIPNKSNGNVSYDLSYYAQSNLTTKDFFSLQRLQRIHFTFCLYQLQKNLIIFNV